jgi:predicted negative regulator of RcsB-dependent stress response
MSKRISRKQLKEDEVLTGFERAYFFVVERQREFGIGAAAVAAIAIVIVLGLGYRERRHAAASHALAQAVKVYESPVVGEESPGAAPGAKTYPSKPEKLREALAAFEKVRQQYWSTPSGKVASYYVAVCHLDQEQATAALETIKEDRQVIIAGLARIALVSVLRDRQQADRAAEMLQDKRYAYPADAAAYFRGLALEDQAKRSAAIEVYREIRRPTRKAARVREEALEPATAGEKGGAS